MRFVHPALIGAALISLPLFAGTQTIDDIRRMARPFEGNNTTLLLPITPEVIPAEPISSLSLADATALAEALAARLPDAFAAIVAKEYTGFMSPAVPANSVLVIEVLTPGKAAIGDLVLFEKDGRPHIRRLLQRIPFRVDASRLVVGYEHAKDRDGISEEQVKGRVIATILFDPAARASLINPEASGNLATHSSPFAVPAAEAITASVKR